MASVTTARENGHRWRVALTGATLALLFGALAIAARVFSRRRLAAASL
jgi:hypothetical protein